MKKIVNLTSGEIEDMKDRAYRRDQDKRVITKRLKLVKQRDNKLRDSSGKTYYEQIAAEPGRLRKHHPYDCGNPRCGLCHSEKLSGKPKIVDVKQAMHGELDEEDYLDDE